MRQFVEDINKEFESLVPNTQIKQASISFLKSNILKKRAIIIKSSIVEMSKNDLIKPISKLFISLFFSKSIIVSKPKYIQNTNTKQIQID